MATGADFLESELQDMDPHDLQELLDAETEDMCNLEEQFAAFQQQQQARKRKLVREQLDTLQAVKERNDLIRRALAGEIPTSAVPRPGVGSRVGSAANTPVGSPLRQPGARISQQRNTFAGTNLNSNGPRGELADILNSVLQIKHGNVSPFVSLMQSSAMQTASNIDQNKLSGEQQQQQQEVRSKTHVNPSNSAVGFPRQNSNFGQLGKIGQINNEVLHAINASQDNAAVKGRECNSNSRGPSANSANANNNSLTGGDLPAVVNNGMTVKEDLESDDDEDKVKKGKKKSGILAKPDETDIVLTVKYPHELLDDRHVKSSDKVFNKLSFPLLCAGELELIQRPGVGQEEREARLKILLTLCYHSCYVDITELRAQYAGTLQRIERGLVKWSPDLADRLHSDLAFRASVLAREKTSIKTDKPTPVASKTDSPKKQESKLPVEGKIHYCADYNRGSCSFQDNHDGKMNGKDVLLWHLCRRCLLSDKKLKRIHPETDEDCPSRS